MPQAHTVDELGRYDGLTLAQAVPAVVDEIVAALNPVEIILFGSVARGAVQTFAPLDIIVADLAEIAADQNNVGSAVYWPLREGVSVYRRPAEDAN